ncbi:MAG: DUF1003 domain-containing protein [Acidimicrobiales bacterium]|nr:DUF1003 domain-containing protein [Acidimicrobiales bacterium]
MTEEATDLKISKNSSWFPWKSAHHHSHPALADAHEDRTLGERVADKIASFGGSWPFIFIFLGLIAGWMIVNSLIIQRVLNGRAFDPYPFIALNLILSALAGLQAPIIMMSQNRAAARDEILASHHYEETLKIDSLLQSNTTLTEQVHSLAAKIHELTQNMANRSS